VAKSLGVSPVDLDGDGWVDLVVANDTVQNFVFLNQGDGTFLEIGATSGVAFDNYGNTRGAMGIDTAWFGNDGQLGIAIGNFANEMTALYVAQDHPTSFADEALTRGVGPASRLLLKFGIFFFDYDLDGWLDLLSANGHLEEEIHKVQQSQSYAQPAQLFWNTGATGGRRFVDVQPSQAGPDLFQPVVGRGSAFADIDGDGDLDVVITQIGGPPLLLRNDQELGHNWLRVRLTGREANRDALGAVVRLTAGGFTQTRKVTPTRGYLSQSELPLTFGLGTCDRVDSLEVIWPGGGTQTVSVTRVNCTLVVQQP
jgi:enediyne biosynthesis protein E4